MASKLTVKQEAFVQDVFTGVTYAQAYRNNYDAENMADNVIWVKASELMANGKVSVRLMKLQERAAERNQVTVGSITKELEENREKADGLDQPAAMNAATMGKAKLHGLLVDKVDAKVEHDISDGMKTLMNLASKKTKRVGEE